MHWGLTTGGWMSGLHHAATDKYKSQIDQAATKGFDLVEFSLNGLIEEGPERCRQIGDWLRQANLSTVLGLRCDPYAGADAAKQAADVAQRSLSELKMPLRVRACVTGMGPHHRFERQPPLAEQLDRMAEGFAPMALALHTLGIALGVHNSNRGYWASDVAELCRRVPHLGVFWDTANAFLMAEQPVSAVDTIAPHIVGTHFKDHYADPAPRGEGLILRCRGAIPGQGDTSLREIFDIIKDKTPNAKDLPMLFEIDPIQDVTKEDALDAAVGLMRELQAR